MHILQTLYLYIDIYVCIYDIYNMHVASLI